MAEQKIQGRLVRTGVVVMESFQIQFDDANGADAKRFDENPREVIEQLLKNEGIAVNGIHMIGGSQWAAGGPILQKTAYHVVHPPAEKSNTIVIN